LSGPFFVSMKNLDNWSRVARAAADARDELRSLIPALDRAISENHPTPCSSGESA
jgi:hypothetical protein